MKKKNISWIFLIVLVIVLTGLYLSRNRWAGYLLKREVAIRSHGNISLTFSSIHLGIFSKRLTILNPTLTYKNTYINAGHSLKLQITHFKKLSAYNLFLWDFFMKGEYIFQEFTVVHPEFQLVSADTVRTKAAPTNLTSWLKFLQKRRLAVVPIKFEIKHAYVKKGKIRLKKSNKTGVFEGADYEISIENLGNLTGNTSTDTVFYKTLKFNVHNIFRKSGKENFSLKIHSITYNSSLQEFILSGLQYHSIQKERDKNLNIDVKWAKIKGLTPDKLPGTFYIKTLDWKGGSITLPERRLSPLFNRYHHKKLRKAMVRNFRYFKFDTLHVDHVHVFRLATNADTLLYVKNFNINILNAWISKETFRRPLRFLTFSSLKFKWTDMYYYNPKKGDQFTSGQVLYKSKGKNIRAMDLKYEKLCPANKKPVWALASKQVEVGNFSGKRFHNKEPQNLSLQLLNPEIQVWQDKTCELPDNKNFSDELKRITFSSLNLMKGSFRFHGKQNKDFILSGLNLFAKDLKEKSDSGRNFLTYDTLYFQAAGSKFSNPGNRLKIKTGAIQMLGKNVSVNKLTLIQNGEDNRRNITIPFSMFTNIQLNPLIFEKTLTGNEADLYHANIIIRQSDTLHNNDTLDFAEQQTSRFPIKVSFSKVNLNKSHLNLTVTGPADSINLKTGINLAWRSLKIGYEKKQFISYPSNWIIKLDSTIFSSRQFLGKMDSAVMNSQRGNLNIRNMLLTSNESKPFKMSFVIKVPLTQMNRIDYTKLFKSDSLVFGKIAFRDAKLHFIVPRQFNASVSLIIRLPEKTILFDSLEINHSNFTVEKQTQSSELKIIGNQLDVLYRPLFRSTHQNAVLKRDFLKKWDVSLKTLHLSDTTNRFRIVVDGISLQSQFNQLFIKSITGNNLPGNGSLAGKGMDFVNFKLQKMKFSGLQLRGPGFRELFISKWTTPVVWLKVTQSNSVPKKQPWMAFLFDKNTSSGFIRGIRIQSTNFKKLNFSYLYDNKKKLIAIPDVGLAIHDIQIDSTLTGNHPHYLFRDMRLDPHGKSIISGDSMYVFRTRDIRANLPQKRISLDSITITPRYKRKVFFKKARIQTDRVTVYGKSIDLDNFDFTTLLKDKVFHVGSVNLNNFNVLFERDKHYPLSDSTRPMPIKMLREIPYKFKADTVKINRGFISYYEYEIKSVNPGIFFIDNFNVYFMNVTDDFAHLKHSAVLKVHGSGQMMRTAKLNFVLVMPYFSPDNQFWFSAQTSRFNLTKLNSLAQNIGGISIKSGYGKTNIQYLSGNDQVAKGNMLFLYKNLKLRLYNRKKAKISKGMGSPFVNFLLNNLIIRSNNPKFLKPPRKGIIYFERNPRKSFINYLWKSCFSGIQSTMGFNNKFQRRAKKTEKKTSEENLKAKK